MIPKKADLVLPSFGVRSRHNPQSCFLSGSDRLNRTLHLRKTCNIENSGYHNISYNNTLPTFILHCSLIVNTGNFQPDIIIDSRSIIDLRNNECDYHRQNIFFVRFIQNYKHKLMINPVCGIMSLSGEITRLDFYELFSPIAGCPPPLTPS